MDIKVKTTGSFEWEQALAGIALRVDQANSRASTKAARDLARRMRVLLSYNRHAPGTPTPAPPGAPPAMVTGGLMRAVEPTRARLVRPGVYRSRVEVNAPQARIQELGGLAGRNHRVRIPARPYAKPATRSEMIHIQTVYRDAWAQAMRL